MKSISPYLLAAFAGLFYTFSFAPFNEYGNFLFLVFPLVFLATQKVKRQSSAFKSFMVGITFGVVHFTSSLYWLCFAFDVAGMKDIAIPGILGLSLYLSLYPGFTCLLTNAISNRFILNTLNSKIKNIILFSCLYSAFEYLRGNLFTGFPWNLPAYAGDIYSLQTASLIGIYGASFISVLCYTSFVLFVDRGVFCETKNKTINIVLIIATIILAYFLGPVWFFLCTPLFLKNKERVYLFAIFTIVSSLWIYGYLRVQVNHTQYNENYSLRMVQASIEQTAKWDKEKFWDNLEKNIQVSSQPSTLNENSKFDAIIWPETAVVVPFQKYPELLESIISRLEDNLKDKGLFITGNIRISQEQGSEGGKKKYFNTLYAVNKESEVIDSYSKKHLTPFGEYMPLRKFIPTFIPVKKLTHGKMDYSSGEESNTLSNHNLPPFQGIICYEAIFPYILQKPLCFSEKGGCENNEYAKPEWILCVTNDSWFGESIGPKQHLAIAIVRSIEQGLPMLRCASSGCSAVIDPCGRILQKTEINQVTCIDTYLPKPLTNGTLYKKLGDWPFFMGIVLLLVFSVIPAHRRKRN